MTTKPTPSAIVAVAGNALLELLDVVEAYPIIARANVGVLTRTQMLCVAAEQLGLMSETQPGRWQLTPAGREILTRCGGAL